MHLLSTCGVKLYLIFSIKSIKKQIKQARPLILNSSRFRDKNESIIFVRHHLATKLDDVNVLVISIGYIIAATSYKSKKAR